MTAELAAPPETSGRASLHACEVALARRVLQFVSALFVSPLFAFPCRAHASQSCAESLPYAVPVPSVHPFKALAPRSVDCSDSCARRPSSFVVWSSTRHLGHSSPREQGDLYAPAIAYRNATRLARHLPNELTTRNVVRRWSAQGQSRFYAVETLRHRSRRASSTEAPVAGTRSQVYDRA